MKYKNADYRAREAHARTLVQTLARRAGWTFKSRFELLPPVLWEGFYDPDAHLVVMGSAGDLPWGLTAGVTESRCTTLVVEPGFAMAGYVTCTFTLLRCAGRQVHWHSGLKVWLTRPSACFSCPILMAMILQASALRSSAATFVPAPGRGPRPSRADTAFAGANRS